MHEPDRILLIEPCDFESYPTGGQLATAVQLAGVCPERFALVGLETGTGPVGRWTEKRLGGRSLPFFAVGRRTRHSRRPLIPARLRWFAELKRHRRAICASNCRRALIQAPETLIGVGRWGLADICYLFPGIENPLDTARYGWARFLSGAFDRALFEALERVNVVLAAADRRSIRQAAARSRGKLDEHRVIQFPTCVDTQVFYPTSTTAARSQLGLGHADPVLVACGRISKGKGWELVLEAFARLRRRRPSGLLLFVGDGEEREALEARVSLMRLSGGVRVTGFVPPQQVALYLNAADVFVSGSEGEGWSVAMLEALACGKPLVATDVSGARELIRDGKNGFVLAERDPALFEQSVQSAMALRGAREVSLRIAEPYRVSNLRARLESVWPGFADLEQCEAAKTTCCARRV